MKPSSSCLPIAAIILAAGEARRMGSLKQLLTFREETLLSHVIGTAADAGFAPVIVVVGAAATDIRAAIASKNVEIVQNTEWRSGMGSSLSAGVRKLQEMGAESAAVAVLVADQPLVTANDLGEMRKLLIATGASVVAAEYNNGTLGVPAIFKRQLFSRLTSLPPETGARSLLRASELEIAPYPLPNAGLDIDTQEDFAALQAFESHLGDASPSKVSVDSAPKRL